jgi:hypothetical protein
MWRPAGCGCGDQRGDRGGGMSGRACCGDRPCRGGRGCWGVRGCWGLRGCWGGQACWGGWGGVGWLRCGAGGRGPGSGRPGSGGYGWLPVSAGCWSQGISDSFHRRCEVCHGDRSTGAFRDPGPGSRGGRPGPPGRPRSARVGLTTGSAARMDRREGPGPAGADPFSLLKGLAAFAAFAALAALAAFAALAAGSAAGWTGSSLAGAGGSASGSEASMPSYQEMGDSPGSGAGAANHSPVTSSSASSPAPAVCGLSAEPLAGERRNQPAGGDTPGKSSLPLAGSASAGATSGRSASGAAAGGEIRPGGTDQGGTTWSGQARPEVPARCGSSGDPGS